RAARDPALASGSRASRPGRHALLALASHILFDGVWRAHLLRGDVGTPLGRRRTRVAHADRRQSDVASGLGTRVAARAPRYRCGTAVGSLLVDRLDDGWRAASCGIAAAGRWGRCWSIGSLMSGALWGIAAWATFPASPPHEALLIVC